MRIYNTISLKRISIILSTFILLINDQLDYGHTADEQCNCSVEKNGEYCGTQLNELNKENSCPKKMFYCGDTNHNKAAVLLVDCQQGQECDVYYVSVVLSFFLFTIFFVYIFITANYLACFVHVSILYMEI